jgi:hypothetical protein
MPPLLPLLARLSISTIAIVSARSLSNSTSKFCLAYLSQVHQRHDRAACEQYSNCYSELVHYVGRLGAHFHDVRIVVKAALMLPSIKKLEDVRKEAVSDVRHIHLPPGSQNPY